MTKFKPTDSELEILHILWDKGDCSVREINDILNNKREVGYTTTLKLLQIMFEKGMVVRDTSNKTHIYKAVAQEKETKSDLLSEFIKTAFKGSSMSLVLQALGNSKSTKGELEELKSLINHLEKKTDYDE